MKKRLLAGLLVIMLLCSMMACSTSTPAKEEQPAATENQTAPVQESSSEPIELSFVIGMYSDKTEDFLLNVVDEFEKAHENVTVTVETLGWDVKGERINAMLGAGVAPDMYIASSASAFVEDEMLYDVRDIMSSELKDSFNQSLWSNCIDHANDDHVWLMPFVASARFLCYNADLLEEAGAAVPKTWSELEATCQKLYDYYQGEIYPYGVEATSTEGSTTILYYGANNGGGYLDADGNYMVNCEENIEAIQFIYDLYKAGYTNPNPTIETRDDQQNLMSAGKLAMMVTLNSFPAKNADMNLKLAAIPYNDANVSISSSMAGLDGLMIFNDSVKEAEDTAERKQAIADFLDYLYSPEVYAAFVEQEGFLATTNDCAAYIVEQDPEQADMYEAIQNALFFPSTRTDWTDVQNAMEEVLGLIFTDAMSVEDGLNSVQESYCE